MLKVAGDSMVEAAICDGDWVVVRQQPNAENGEIVAAMIDGEATVKTYKRRDGHVWLLPHNPAYEPIPGDDATILGRWSPSSGASDLPRAGAGAAPARSRRRRGRWPMRSGQVAVRSGLAARSGRGQSEDPDDDGRHERGDHRRGDR